MESQRALADRLFPTILSQESDDIELKNIPPEQRRLHTETADLTVSSIHGYLASSKIQIPEFQRGYVWTRIQASRLIESLLIQCPIPVVYFSQGADTKLVVIDGNQRLWSIKLFLNDAFELQGLSTYPELNGYSWSDLDPRFRDHISNRTIRCITILKDTHPQIKFDVFERLNTGSVKLNAQELRHGINHGLIMKELDTLTKLDTWKAVTGFRADKRMKGAELVLRYFAFRYDRQSYQKPLTSFLDQYSTKTKGLKADEVKKMANEFKATLSLVYNALGKLAFRMYEADATSPFNSALYDAEMIGFAETSNQVIRSHKYKPAALHAYIAKLFKSERFVNSIRQATSDELLVRTRIEMFTDHLNAFK